MVAGTGIVVVCLLPVLSGMLKYIPNDRIGVVERLWSPRGSVQTGLLALMAALKGTELRRNVDAERPAA